MLLKLSYILIFSLIAFAFSFALYPFFITLLQKRKAGKSIREETAAGDQATIFQGLHQHKAGTPTMGGVVFLVATIVMVVISVVLYSYGYINNSLFNANETYIPLFGLLSMGLLGLVDDIVNIQGKNRIKGLSAKLKLLWMFLFSAFISRWFYSKLGVTYINIWPFGGNVPIGLRYPVLSFFFTVAIVNAINITDGLDGLVGGMTLIVLAVLAIITFMTKRYLSTTILGIVSGSVLAFLWRNIYPAKIFMGDAGALGLGGLIASLVYLINIRIGIIIPFMILFSLFWMEIGSSALQLFWKKYYSKKLFVVAPFHHLLEYYGYTESSIVMKAWLLQGVLGLIAMIMMLYQWYGLG